MPSKISHHPASSLQAHVRFPNLVIPLSKKHVTVSTSSFTGARNYSTCKPPFTSPHPKDKGYRSYRLSEVTKKGNSQMSQTFTNITNKKETEKKTSWEESRSFNAGDLMSKLFPKKSPPWNATYMKDFQQGDEDRSIPFPKLPQRRLPVSYYRGGTSRALIFHRNDLPPFSLLLSNWTKKKYHDPFEKWPIRSDFGPGEAPKEWAEIFLKCIGSPDSNGRQLDGMGGGISSLSKVLVVWREDGKMKGNHGGLSGIKISGPKPGQEDSASSHPRQENPEKVKNKEQLETEPKEEDDPEEVVINYTFASVGIRNGVVDFSANCGNMSSAVGPFAVNEGLIDVNRHLLSQPIPYFFKKGETTAILDPRHLERSQAALWQERLVKIKIRNTNTGKVMTSTFPVVGTGKVHEQYTCNPLLHCYERSYEVAVEAATVGEEEIDGVEGGGARVELGFLRPGGSKTGKLFPTNSRITTFDSIPTTCIDCGNPTVIIPFSSLISHPILSSHKLTSTMLPTDLEAHPTLLPFLEDLRCQAAVAMGIAKTLDTVPEGIPKIAIVSAPEKHVLSSGKEIGPEDVDVIVRAVSVGQWHKAVPVTVAMSIAVAAGIKESVVASVLGNREGRKKAEIMIGKKDTGNGVESDGVGEVIIGHPGGKMKVGVEFDEVGEVESVRIVRTAKRIMKGEVYYR